MIKLLVAFDPNRLIGCGDQLCWHIPEDLKHFKNQTINKVVLFGQRTFDGLGRTLPNRDIVVLSLDKELSYEYDNVVVVNDYQEILDKYQDNPDNEIVIAGGASIYKLFLDHVDELVITHVKKEYEGDVHFPEIDFSIYKEEVLEETEDYVIKKYVKK